MCRSFVRAITRSSNMRSSEAITWKQISHIHSACVSLQRRSPRLRHISSFTRHTIGAELFWG
jgi:hypothetical protein